MKVVLQRLLSLTEMINVTIFSGQLKSDFPTSSGNG